MLLIWECLLPHFPHVAESFRCHPCGTGETCIHCVRKCLGLLAKIFTCPPKPTLLWLFRSFLLSLCTFLLLLLCLLSPKGRFLSLLCRLLLRLLCLLLCFSPLCRLLFLLLLLSSLPLPLEQAGERVQRGLRTVHVGLRVTLFGLRVEVLEEVLQTHLIA